MKLYGVGVNKHGESEFVGFNTIQKHLIVQTLKTPLKTIKNGRFSSDLKCGELWSVWNVLKCGNSDSPCRITPNPTNIGTIRPISARIGSYRPKNSTKTWIFMSKFKNHSYMVAKGYWNGEIRILHVELPLVQLISAKLGQYRPVSAHIGLKILQKH